MSRFHCSKEELFKLFRNESYTPTTTEFRAIEKQKEFHKKTKFYISVTKREKVKKAEILAEYVYEKLPGDSELRLVYANFFDDNNERRIVCIPSSFCFGNRRYYGFDRKKLTYKTNYNMYSYYGDQFSSGVLIFVKSKPSWLKYSRLTTQVFNSNKHYIVSEMIRKYLANPKKFETIIQLKYYALLSIVDRDWISDKIVYKAYRKYGENFDWRMYIDYIRMLRTLEKDYRNPKYYLPVDFNKAHDDAVKKIQEIERKKRVEEWIKKYGNGSELNQQYVNRVNQLLGVDLGDDVITIKPLKTITEFIEEGEEMHHCVFANRYYEEESSLILSAKVDGQRIETIELSKEDALWKIEQCRGKFNKPSNYHDRIIKLLNQNMNRLEGLNFA